MKALFRIACLYIAVGLYVGCSPVKFAVDKDTSVGQTCIQNSAGGCSYDYSVTVGGGKVDILIVDDNSASMSFEQKNLSSRFAGFISQLDNASIDYRIGITTTDISIPGDGNNARAINGNGALQNGNLIGFASGVPFLTPNSGTQAQRVSMFNNTIVRGETAQCEKFIADWVQNNGMASTNGNAYAQQYLANCPSGDERGVYAANLVVKNNPSNFIRADASLAIIFLSDEDERSGLYYSQGYALADYDKPENLVANIASTLGNGKSTSIHSIVVKDNSCLSVQNNQTLSNSSDVPVAATKGMVSGSIGTNYLYFANKALGQAVDICSLGYTSALGNISSSIMEQINSVALMCSSPSSLVVTVASSDNTITWNVEGKEVHFNKQLPVGTSVHVSYECNGAQ